ncbi:MAG: AsnC family transcriptional regulator, partial [Pseudomonas sp.]
MPVTLDRTDKALLNALQSNARLTVAELAERVSLTTSP